MPGNDICNTIYYTEVRALSRFEKESKYSSKILSMGNLPKPRNSYDLDSAAGMNTANRTLIFELLSSKLIIILFLTV